MFISTLSIAISPVNEFPAIPSNITCGKCWVVVSNIPDTFYLLILPYGRGEVDDDDDDDDDDDGDDDNDEDNDTLARITCALAHFFLLPIHSE